MMINGITTSVGKMPQAVEDTLRWEKDPLKALAVQALSEKEKAVFEKERAVRAREHEPLEKERLLGLSIQNGIDPNQP